MFTIKVYRKVSGSRGVAGKEVKVHSSLGTTSARTDSNGAANFALSNGRYKVYVDGKIVHDGPVVGTTVVYI